jgi:hypothetical protein
MASRHVVLYGVYNQAKTPHSLGKLIEWKLRNVW